MEKFVLEGGEARVSREGLLTVIEAETVAQRQGILRLAARCGAGLCPVGVLVPENGRLRLHRKLSRTQMRDMGLEDIEGFVLATEEELQEKTGEGQENVEEEAPGEEETAQVPEETQEKTSEETPVEAEKKENPQPVPKKSCGWFASLDDLAWEETAAPGRLFRDQALGRAARDVRGALTTENQGQQLLAIPMDSDRPFPPLPVFRFGEPALIRGHSYVIFRLADGNLVR